MPRKLLPVADFAKLGLNSDFMPWELQPGYVTDLHNIRIIRNRLVPFGGYSPFADLPDAAFIPGLLMFINSTSGKYWLICGQDAIWAYDGSTWSDVTGTAFSVPNPEDWVGCLLANIPVLNNPGTYPQYWSPQALGSPVTDLPFDSEQSWRERGEGCRIIRSHKQFLFAMDLTTVAYGSTPDGVRWSAPADINGIPPTWDELDVTNVAGLTTLGGTGGRIVDGLGLRDAFVVYRESAITIFDYVPNSPYVWRIRELMSTVGAVSADSIVEVKGKHYFIGDGDILYNDGNRVESLLHNRIRKRFLSDYNPETFRNSYAVKNSALYEVWFCVPSVQSEFPDIAYIYNWRDDTWSVRDIPVNPSASYGTKGSSATTWDSVPNSWDTTPLLWSQDQLTPLDDTLVCVSQPSDGNPGQLIYLDINTDDVTTSLTTLFDARIERTGFALEGLSRVTTITSIYPHMTGPGSMYIRLGSQDYPGSPIRWKTPVLFNPETDRKVDIRTTGELHCFQFYSHNTQSTWAIAGMDVEYAPAGER